MTDSEYIVNKFGGAYGLEKNKECVVMWDCLNGIFEEYDTECQKICDSCEEYSNFNPLENDEN